MEVHAPLRSLLICALAAAPAPAAQAPARDGGLATQVESFEELEADWNEALLAWAGDWYARWQQDPEGAGFGPSPSADFWPRYEALARAGDDRALSWLLQQLDQTGAPSALRSERARWLLERVRAAGPAPWLAEALPLLVECRASLGDDEALRAALHALAADDVDPAALSREARLGLAELASGADALVLQLDAFRRPDEPHLDLDAAGTEALDVVAGRVASFVREAGRAHFEAYHVTAGDVHVGIPGAPSEPEQRLRPALEGLAEAGSVTACLWVIENTRPEGSREVERVRAHLERVAAAELDSHELSGLAWNLSGLVAALGPEPVEAALETLVPQADEETQARFLFSYGLGLCDLQAEHRARGLEVLRDVTERFPETRAGGAAAGALFRLEQLVVGQTCPDFEARDFDGASFRLSDYRGKVTVLDFWGFW